MIGNDWDTMLAPIYKGDYFEDLLRRVQHEYSIHTVYPGKKEVFNALKLTPFKDIKVVIVGQDPYHGEGEAHGLSFSVRDGVKLPPSLKNIYKDKFNGFITPEQILLLNSTLTVVKDTPNSHSNIGWQQFTDDVISLIDKNRNDVVFILWGNYARSKKALIKNNYIIESAHPSPFSARNGFFGSKPFSKTNAYLKSKGVEEIKW